MNDKKLHSLNLKFLFSMWGSFGDAFVRFKKKGLISKRILMLKICIIDILIIKSLRVLALSFSTKLLEWQKKQKTMQGSSNLKILLRCSHNPYPRSTHCPFPCSPSPSQAQTHDPPLLSLLRKLCGPIVILMGIGGSGNGFL